MNRMFDMFDVMKEKYPFLIGSADLKELATFSTGYEFAIEQFFNERVGFGGRFLAFVTYREEKEHCDLYWDKILLKNYPPEEAFWKFFEYLEEFKEWIKHPEKEKEEVDEISMRGVKCFKNLWGLE